MWIYMFLSCGISLLQVFSCYFCTSKMADRNFVPSCCPVLVTHPLSMQLPFTSEYIADELSTADTYTFVTRRVLYGTPADNCFFYAHHAAHVCPMTCLVFCVTWDYCDADVELLPDCLLYTSDAADE